MIELRSFVFFFFNNPNIEMVEDFFTLKLVVNATNFKVPNSEDINQFLKELPNRDKVTIHISMDGMDDVTFHSSLKESTLEQFISELKSFEKLKDHDSEFEMVFKVNKKVDYNNTLTIYSFESLINYLEQLKLIGLLHEFKQVLSDNEYIIFDLLDTNDTFYTHTFFFTHDRNDITLSHINRENILRKRLYVSNFLNASDYTFIPEDFYMVKKCYDEKFNKIMYKLSLVFSLINISDFSKIDGNSLYCRIDGYKLVDNYIDFDNIDLNDLMEYYYIYRWIYNEGNLSDKVGLARNVISLHLKDNNLLLLEKNTLKSIQSSHEIYLKQNIQQYIEVKNKVSDYLFELSQKSNDVVDSFSNSLKSYFFAFITFFISVVIFNSLSGGKLKDIFTRDIVLISYAILIGSFLFLLGSILETQMKEKRFKDHYERLKNEYTDILQENDIKNIFLNDEYLNDDIKFIRKKTAIYSIIWVVSIIVFYIIINSLSIK